MVAVVYLERSCVATIPSSSAERKFHIFYYHIAGASPEERQHLHLLIKPFTGTWDRVGRRQPDPVKAVTVMVYSLISSK